MTIVGLLTHEAAEALNIAIVHVCRQQHAGSHEQDRLDAMAWLDAYTTEGRCTCSKCARQWKAAHP